MPAERKAWRQNELLVVFRLYCRTPFGRLHQRNPEIVELAELIGRTPAAVAMKACNFASLDPQQQARQIKALGNASRADRDMWEAFLNDSETLANEAEAAFSTMTGKEVAGYIPESDFPIAAEGIKSEVMRLATGEDSLMSCGITEKYSWTKERRVQSFFRAAVLTSYNNRCALTDLAIPELLNASHIIPWRIDEKRRADPRNGICLNALHDRAFDRGLISLDKDLRIMVSSRLDTADICDLQRNQLLELSGCPLRLPYRFQPSCEAIEYHRTEVYRP